MAAVILITGALLAKDRIKETLFDLVRGPPGPQEADEDVRAPRVISPGNVLNGSDLTSKQRSSR